MVKYRGVDVGRVEKIRVAPDNRLIEIVMKIEMDGGHGGASGRYVQWKERAWDYAFVADSLGATELLPGAGLK